MKAKDIVLNNPLVFDISKNMEHIVNQFESIDDFKNWMKKNMGWDTWPYDGRHRYGEDSSTDVSDITYDMLQEGTELYCYMKPKGYPKQAWVPVRVIHKYHNMVFFKCLLDDYVFYADCGADDYDWHKIHEKFEPALPTHGFAPAEVIVPDYVDITEWALPKITIINKAK